MWLFNFELYDKMISFGELKKSCGGDRTLFQGPIPEFSWRD